MATKIITKIWNKNKFYDKILCNFLTAQEVDFLSKNQAGQVVQADLFKELDVLDIPEKVKDQETGYYWKYMNLILRFKNKLLNRF